MINKDTYKRFTKKEGFRQNLDLTQELGYSHIYNRLAELEDKIENRTLIELPCQVGDTVYHIDNVGDEIHEGKIKKIIYDLGYMAFDETAIGTGIFLTKEAVEAKCKELQEKSL